MWTKQIELDWKCRKNTRKKSDSNSRPLHLKRIPNDLQKKKKFRWTYLLTNKKESVVLGSFTFESSTTNFRHMLGLYVSLRNTRKKLLFYLVIRNEFYLFRSQMRSWIKMRCRRMFLNCGINVLKHLTRHLILFPLIFRLEYFNGVCWPRVSLRGNKFNCDLRRATSWSVVRPM